jgi:N-formylglutamate deformylase
MLSGPAFDLMLPPAHSGPVIFASPHSGRDYPRAFLESSILDPRTLRSSEDAYVDRLIAGAPGLGVPVIAARVPRAFVDLNRAADEFDPLAVEDVSRGITNPRVAAGLGVIPRVVANGRPIRRDKIPRAEAEARLAACWHPYHEALAALIGRTQAREGGAVLIDWHSMPHEAIAHLAPGGRGPAADVVLGDRFGAAAAPEISAAVEAAFRDAGFRVARNTPFAGAYVAQTYGRPADGLHVVQVELDRALYLDEGRIHPHAGFDRLCARLAPVLAVLSALSLPRRNVPLAAE